MSASLNRFEDKYMPEPNSGCWIWVGAISHGYGSFKEKGKSVRAHRLSYETHVGKIPDNMVIDHLCRNTFCVNPHHLEVVTQKINIQRGDTGKWCRPGGKSQKSNCKNGHEYNKENAYLDSLGYKRCRACARVSRNKYNQENM